MPSAKATKASGEEKSASPVNWLTILAVIVPLILGVAYMTLAERKVIAAAQFRHGPNVVGPFGVLQPWADALKLMFKEVILPAGANKVVFFLAPMLTFALAMLAWAVMPITENFAIADINLGLLYLFAISSLGVYGIIMSGWLGAVNYGVIVSNDVDKYLTPANATV